MIARLARLVLTTIALLASGAPHAHALDALHEQGYYRISWNGIGLGRVRTEISERDGAYFMRVDTKSKGIVNLFSPFETIASAEGIVRDARYVPHTYLSRAIRSNEGKNRKTTLRYDETGVITERLRVPLDDPAWRPEVPLDEIDHAPDPISAFLQLRAALQRNVAQGVRETHIRMYDGRRLAGFTVQAIQRGQTIIDGKPAAIVHTVLRRLPINGYTPKEWKKFKKGDPTVYAWFSDDGRFMPIRLEVSLMIGILRIEQTEE